MDKIYALQYKTTRGVWITIQTFASLEEAQEVCDRSTSVIHRRACEVFPGYKEKELRACYPEAFI